MTDYRLDKRVRLLPDLFWACEVCESFTERQEKYKKNKLQTVLSPVLWYHMDNLSIGIHWSAFGT